jgi:hypothetical protein
VSASTDVSSVQEGGVGNQNVKYTYKVTNTSPASTDPITVSAISDGSGDLLPAFKAANGGSATIAFGASVTFSVTETAPTQNAGTTYTNTINVKAADDESDPANSSTSATISYTNVAASSSVSASTDVPSVQEGGVGNQSVKYTYKVTNTSPASTDPITVSAIGDNTGSLLSAFEAANGGSATIADGASVTFSVTEPVPTQNAGTTYTNTINVKAADDESDPANSSTSATISYSDVAASSSVSASTDISSVQEGGVGNQSVKYSYTVTNTSPASTDPITLSAISDGSGDLLPAFKAANGGSATIPFAGSVTFSVTETVPTQNAATTYTNTVSVKATDDESDPANSTAGANITYTDVLPSSSVSASTDVSSVQEGGVGNQNVKYTYKVTNTSPATTDPITLSAIGDGSGDLLPAFKAANGGSATIPYAGSVTFSVTETVPTQNAGTTYTNTINVKAADDESDPANSSASATISYTDVTPSLSATSSTNVPSVPADTPNEQVIYTYKVTNTSPATTDPVTISSISDNSGDLLSAFKSANSGSATIPYGATVKFSVTEAVPMQHAGTTYTNTMTVAGNDDENDAASASASSTISYSGQGNNLTVTLNGPNTANEGDTKHYTFTSADSNANVTFTLVSVSGGQVGNVSNIQFDTNTGDGSFDVFFTDGGASPTTSTVSVQVEDSLSIFSNVASINVSVSNVPPSNLSISLSSNHINEGGSTNLTGSFNDPGILDTHKVYIDWGDGTANNPDIQVVNLPADVLTFGNSGDSGIISHTYIDNPAGQPNGSYTIAVYVVDKDGGTSSTVNSSIEVDNVAPTASITGPASAMIGEGVTFTGVYNDAGIADLPTESLVWTVTNAGGKVVAGGSSGNGTTVSSGTYKQDFSFALSKLGNYTVSLTVTDKDGGTVTVTKTLSIVPGQVAMQPDPFDPSKMAQVVVGTSSNDTIIVTPTDSTGITYTVKMKSGNAHNFTTFGTAFRPNGHIIVYGGAGNDTIDLVANGNTMVSVPALLFGEAGNDILDATGSSAANVLDGGTGDDIIYDGTGRTIEIGGGDTGTTGHVDQFNTGGAYGNQNLGEDVIIRASTSYDNDTLALISLLNEWNSADSFSTRQNLMTTGVNGYKLDSTTVGTLDTLDAYFIASGKKDVSEWLYGG